MSSAEMPPKVETTQLPEAVREALVYSADPLDLTTAVPDVSKLGDIVTLTDGVMQAGEPIDSDALDKLTTIGNPDNWIIRNPDVVAKLRMVAEGRDLGSLTGIKEQIIARRDRLEAETGKTVTYDEAAAAVVEAAKARLQLSDDLRGVARGIQTTKSAPVAESAQPDKKQDHRNNPGTSSTRGKGAPKSKTSHKSDSKPAPKATPPKQEPAYQNPLDAKNQPPVSTAKPASSPRKPVPASSTKTSAAAGGKKSTTAPSSMDINNTVSIDTSEQNKTPLSAAEAAYQKVQDDWETAGRPHNKHFSELFRYAEEQIGVERGINGRQNPEAVTALRAEIAQRWPKDGSTPSAAPDTSGAAPARSNTDPGTRPAADPATSAKKPAPTPAYTDPNVKPAPGSGASSASGTGKAKSGGASSAATSSGSAAAGAAGGTPGGSTSTSGETGNNPPQSSLKDIEDELLRHFEDGLDNGVALDDPAFRAKLDTLDDTLFKEFTTAFAKTAGVAPDSDAAKQAFEAYSAAAIDAQVDQMRINRGLPSMAEQVAADQAAQEARDEATRLSEEIEAQLGDLQNAKKAKAGDYLAKAAAMATLIDKIKETDPAEAKKWQDWYDTAIVPELEKVEQGISRPKLMLARAKVALDEAARATAGNVMAARGEAGSKRRKIVNAAIGAVAVGVAGYIGYKFGVSHGGGGSGAAEQAASGGGGGPTPQPENPAPTPKVQHVTVESGDNVWKIVTEANGGNNNVTGNMLENGQVSVTDHVTGEVRVSDTANLDLIHPGDTVSFTLPTSGGNGAAAQEAASQAANANVEVLPEYNSQTGAGTVSGATLEHLHDLNIDVPDTNTFNALVDKVVAYNDQQGIFKPGDVTRLPVGQEVHFPPPEVLQEWMRKFIEESDKIKTT